MHWVRGFQTAKEAPFPLQAAACCKHFVANELEAWNGTDRHHVDSYVPQQDLVDYLPSFQACVEQGNVAGVMCSCAFRARSRACTARAWLCAPRMLAPARCTRVHCTHAPRLRAFARAHPCPRPQTTP